MNPWQTFEALLAELPGAQTALADTVRALVYKTDPSLFERLDFEDDHTFLEPGLFAYFTAPNPRATLEQLVFSYLPTARKPRRLRVYADAKGRIHVPRLGRLSGAARDTFCELDWDSATGMFFADGFRDPLPQSYPDYVDGSSVTVGQTVDPLLFRFVVDDWSKRDCRVQPVNYVAHVGALSRAFLTMRTATPALFNALRTVTRRIFLYNADRPNSFATLSAHGVAFLNVKHDNDDVFFLDDLAHQCGHIMFNALTHDKDRFLARPADTPLREFCGDPDEPRSLYSAFHGLFTFSTILWILQACVARREFSDRQRHEALGRLAFNLNKIAIDLNNLSTPGLFTEDGQVLYALFESVYETVFRDYHGVASDFDLSNQPYVFDYTRFAALNSSFQTTGARAARPVRSA